MARDKHGRTLHAGDPVSIGDLHIQGVVRVAQNAQTCITVDWTPPDAYDSALEGSLVEYWGPEEQQRWAEAREADVPKGEPVVAPPPPPAPVEQPSQPAHKPHAVHAQTTRDAHKHKK